ncbi:MAG: sugar phosphate nucleotidyltransferase [Vicinamibacteraceae bacterium]
MRQATDADLRDPMQAQAAESGAKAMMPISGPMRDAAGAFVSGSITRPFLDYIVSALADAGYTDVCLVVAPDHDAIARHYAEAGAPRRVRVAFAVQDEPIGTANAVAAAEPWTGDDPFLVINGDNYYAVPTLASLVGRAGAATALYRAETLVRQSNIPIERIRAFALGVVEHGGLARIVEKPTPEQAAALGDAALVSMTCWRMPPAIHAACRRVARSVRGEFELVDAVNALLAEGVRFEVVVAEHGVLDLSRRGDIAAVEDALAGVTVDP